MNPDTDLVAGELLSTGGVPVDAILRSAEPNVLDPGKHYAIIDPAGGVIEIDTRGDAEWPERPTGRVVLFDTDSFISYVNDHNEGRRTHTFADIHEPTIESVLDWHGPTAEDGAPGWGEHRAVLEFRPTPEWAHWTRADGKLMSQVEFAEHLEVGGTELVEPPAADMLQLAKTFQATSSVEFKEATVLESGARQFAYQETIASKAGQRSDIEVPAEFVIGVAPFEGTEPYRVTCRLRYRLSPSGLSIGYQMHRPHLVVEAAVEDIISRISEGTSIEVLRGKAP